MRFRAQNNAILRVRIYVVSKPDDSRNITCLLVPGSIILLISNDDRIPDVESHMLNVQKTITQFKIDDSRFRVVRHFIGSALKNTDDAYRFHRSAHDTTSSAYDLFNIQDVLELKAVPSGRNPIAYPTSLIG